MRISDWSSDVCSSDLRRRQQRPDQRPFRIRQISAIHDCSSKRSSESEVRLNGNPFCQRGLDGPDSSSNYEVRPDGPRYGPPSVSFKLALKHMLLHSHDYITKVIGIKDRTSVV